MDRGSTDLSTPARSLNLAGCMPSSSCSSPSSSWRLAGGKNSEATFLRRLQLDVFSRAVGWCGHRAWRKLLRRLAQETKCVWSSPPAASRPITFGYDAASYAKNFDDGRRPPAYPYAAPTAVKSASL